LLALWLAGVAIGTALLLRRRGGDDPLTWVFALTGVIAPMLVSALRRSGRP
jgi:hypothetical protein